MITRDLCAAVVMAAVIGSSGAGAMAGDAAEGQRIAERWCTSCHLVSPSDDPSSSVSASDVAPPFSKIAMDPTRTEGSLRVWLSDPHPPMPSLDLDRREIDNLIAYIQSLASSSE